VSTTATTVTIEQQRASSAPIAGAAWAVIAGALLQLVLGIPLASLQAQSPLPGPIAALNALNHLLLIAGVLGLAWSGAAGSGRLGRGGLLLALLGLSVLTLAELVAVRTVGAAEALYGAATLTLAAGLLLTGIAVLRAGRWTGWRRFVPLACGLYIPLVLFPSFALPGPASHYAIGLWGVCWLLLGVALLGESGDRVATAAPRA
jgi:hypothetical protein